MGMFEATRSPSCKTPSFSKSKAVQLEGTKSRKSLISLAGAQKLTSKSPQITETSQSTKKETSKSSSKFCNTLKKTPKTAKKFTDITLRSSQPTEKSLEQKSFKESIKKIATCNRRSPRTCLTMATTKLSPSGHPSALPRLLKENVKPVNLSLISPAPSKQDASQKQEISDSVPKRLEYDPKTDSNITSSFVQHKGVVKPLTKRNTLKNMAQRKPRIKSRQEIREGQKKILKGVRFNRRFELQMANRGITI
ncbi:uncharacterized protein [Panulirus ornatus]|uniref:uncharacterized protein n=1 Tax=Panulirus ornatus TaxID=150431 RepID=UPI003A8741F6